MSDAAEMLGISQSTAKTHLKGVFRKTGVSKQSELVKLIAGFAAPLMQAAAATTQGAANPP